MDVLSFQKTGIQLGMYQDHYEDFKNKAFIITRINRKPFFAIIEPYLRGGAAASLYKYWEQGYIYASAYELNKTLLNGKELISGDKVRLMIETYIYDATLPLFVIVRESEKVVYWQVACVFNRWWASKEMPLFQFEVSQYREALQKLKAIVDEDKRIPCESCGEYHGGMRCGKREGHGIFIWRSGAEHEGTWIDGLRHGKFIYTDENGTCRNESWRHGCLARIHGVKQ